VPSRGRLVCRPGRDGGKRRIRIFPPQTTKEKEGLPILSEEGELRFIVSVSFKKGRKGSGGASSLRSGVSVARKRKDPGLFWLHAFSQKIGKEGKRKG